MLKDGGFYVFYLKGTSKVLDVYGGGTDNGTNIQIYDYCRVPNQRFQALKRGDYYMFKDQHSGKMIDVEASKVENGTNIQLYEQNDTDAQKWKLINAGEGYYSLQSKLNSNYCLDVKGCGTSNGTNVWLYEKNNSDAQKFKIVEKELYKYRVGTRPLCGNNLLLSDITHAALLIGTDLFEYGTQKEAMISSGIRYLNQGFLYNTKKVDDIMKKLSEEKGIELPQGFVRRRNVGRDENFNWDFLGNKLNGTTWTQPDELEEILKNSGEWTNWKYDVFCHNCHDFVRECLRIVGANQGTTLKVLPVFRPH